jgi:hypothetical protein
MTEQDLRIQDLKDENKKLKEELQKYKQAGKQVCEIADRIYNYCEEIDYHIPENERSGYKMLPDILKIHELLKGRD